MTYLEFCLVLYRVARCCTNGDGSCIRKMLCGREGQAGNHGSLSGAGREGSRAPGAGDASTVQFGNLGLAAGLAQLGDTTAPRSRDGTGFAMASGPTERGAQPWGAETEQPSAGGRADGACRGAGAGEGCDRRGRRAQARPHGGRRGFARGGGWPRPKDAVRCPALPLPH